MPDPASDANRVTADTSPLRPASLSGGKPTLAGHEARLAVLAHWRDGIDARLGGLETRVGTAEGNIATHIHDEQAHDPRFAVIDGRFVALRDDLTRVVQEEMARFIAQGTDSQDALRRQLNDIRAIAVTSREDAEHRKARERHMEKQDEEMAELRHLLQVQTAIEAKRQEALKEAERAEAEREEERRAHIAAVAAQTEAQTTTLSAQIAAQNKQLGDTLTRYFGPIGVAAFSYFLVGSQTAGQTRTVALAIIALVVIVYIIAQMVRRAQLARRLRLLQQSTRAEEKTGRLP